MLYRILIAVCLFAAAGFANAEPLSGSKLLLQTLLTDDNPHFVLMGAKVVQRDSAADQGTLDIVAELLVERTVAHAATGADLDTVAWLMKALSASKSARYRAVIEKAIAVYAHEKVTSWGNLSLAELTEPSESVYSAGAISLEQVRKQLLDERTALGRGTAANFSAIKAGDSLDTVIPAMGYPDELIEKVASGGWGVVRIRSRSLQLQYYGRGLVHIDNHFVAGKGWTVSVVWPDVPTKAAPYSGPRPDDARLIMTTEPMLLRKLAKRLLSQRVTETELLDRAAERIQVLANRKDEFEIDAIALLIRLLAASGDKKYIEALGSVEARSEDSGLAYRAKLAREQLQAL